MIQECQFSCSKFTIYVKTNDEIIVDTAPVARKFIGQHRRNLISWLKKFGLVKFYNLNNY